MSDAVDIIQLDPTSILVSIRYGNEQRTHTFNIPIISIRMITITQQHVRIFHGSNVEELTITDNVEMLD